MDYKIIFNEGAMRKFIEVSGTNERAIVSDAIKAFGANLIEIAKMAPDYRVIVLINQKCASMYRNQIGYDMRQYYVLSFARDSRMYTTIVRGRDMRTELDMQKSEDRRAEFKGASYMQGRLEL